MPGSKSIRVFTEGFGEDTQSLKLEAEVCGKLADANPHSECGWNSIKTTFWINERSEYFSHFCPGCGCKFNYPVSVKACPKCDLTDLKSVGRWIGKIEAASSKEWNRSSDKRGELNPHFVEAAKQDLREHPVHEEGFDWGYLKDNL
jgi:hypothetical protein